MTFEDHVATLRSSVSNATSEDELFSVLKEISPNSAEGYWASLVWRIMLFEVELLREKLARAEAGVAWREI